MTTPHDPPEDDDLIAYLDGELDADTERVVESQLAADPTARSKAEQYKKTFDLLDYLPKPEPSAEFASRTVTSVLPVGPASPATSAFVPVPSSSLPIRRRWPELLGWAVATVLAGVGAYFVHAAVKPEVRPDERLDEADLPVIQKLPLYVGVDGVEFLRGLEKTDLFDTDAPPPPADQPNKVLADDLPRLIAQFKALPPARKQQLRTLHQQLTDPALPDRDALLRTLEGYAVWLDRLPDADRRRVLDAPPHQRLEAVEGVAEVRWREGLSDHKQQALRRAVGEEKAELLAVYRDQERARRNEWQLAQRQWKGLTGKSQTPWPFSEPGLNKQIDEYIRTEFGIDPTKLQPTKDRKGELPAECRLTADELLDLRVKREAAYQDGYWFAYGALLLRLSEQHPTLPRPKAGEPITRPSQLPKGYVAFREFTPRARWGVGKWPEFALEVARTARPDPRLEPLGPCKPDEFADSVREFVTKTLTDADRKRLDRHLGKWPDYPQELLRIAKEKKLGVPDVTLPGDPTAWQEFYQLPGGKK